MNNFKLLSISIILLGISSEIYPDAATGYNPQALSGGLTDEEQKTKETYIHHEYIDKVYKDACKGKEDICEGKDPDGSKNAMIGGLSKAYALVVGTIDHKIKFKKKDEKKNSNQQDKETDKKETEPKTDYCKHIAQATEIITTFKQHADQNNIGKKDPAPEIYQKEMLYRASRTHGKVAENSKVAATGWGATTACYTGYVAYAATSGYAVGTTLKSVGLKLAASALFTIHYTKQIAKQKSYAEDVKKIADKLPGKGDCNPVSENDCYCSQESTKNDPKYCLVQIYQRQASKDAILTTCIDNKMKTDPTCKCEKSSSCYDKQYMSNIKGLGLGSNRTQSMAKSMNQLTNGQISSGSSLARTSNTKANAARNLLKRNDHKFKVNRPLSLKMKREAEALEAMGLSRNIARSIAATPESQASKNAFSKLRRSNFNFKRSNRKSEPKVVRYKSGNQIRKKSNKSKNKFDFMNKFKSKKNKIQNGKVLRFAEKASRRAQISKDTRKSIFEIITRRYRVTGVGRLK